MRSPLSFASLSALTVSLFVCFGISGLGGAVTAGPVRDWYPQLEKLSLTPPPIAFPIVWTALYLLMALAAWRLWLVAGWYAARRAFGLFGIQLLLNLAWSVLFFGLQQPAWALAELVVLWLAIAATAREFARHDRWAGWSFAPYLAWVSFAAILNAGIVWLN